MKLKFPRNKSDFEKLLLDLQLNNTEKKNLLLEYNKFSSNKK
jgi:hypothetical protein